MNLEDLMITGLSKKFCGIGFISFTTESDKNKILNQVFKYFFIYY